MIVLVIALVIFAWFTTNCSWHAEKTVVKVVLDLSYFIFIALALYLVRQI